MWPGDFILGHLSQRGKNKVWSDKKKIVNEVLRAALSINTQKTGNNQNVPLHVTDWTHWHIHTWRTPQQGKGMKDWHLFQCILRNYVAWKRPLWFYLHNVLDLKLQTSGTDSWLPGTKDGPGGIDGYKGRACGDGAIVSQLWWSHRSAQKWTEVYTHAHISACESGEKGLSSVNFPKVNLSVVTL